MRTPPERWQQTPWGDEGGGFWVAGLIGMNVVWYDDIEGGFQYAPYTKLGVLDEYRCNQDQLEQVIRWLPEILTGRPPVDFGRWVQPKPSPKTGQP